MQRNAFFVVDPISDISEAPHVIRIFNFNLKLAQICKNVTLPVLVKSYTSIDEILEFGNSYT